MFLPVHVYLVLHLDGFLILGLVQVNRLPYSWLSSKPACSWQSACITRFVTLCKVLGQERMDRVADKVLYLAQHHLAVGVVLIVGSPHY